MNSIYKEQIAGMNLHYALFSFDYFLEAQLIADIQNIELWGGAPHFWMDSFSYSDCKKTRMEITKRGLNLIAFTPESCIYPYQVAARYPEYREHSLRYFKNGIRATSELGCQLMTINSGWGLRDESKEEAWKRSSDMLAALAKTAAEEGVILALESLRIEESNLVTTLQDTQRMITEIGEPTIKPMIDTAALSSAGESLQDWFDGFKNDIVHMHFVDGSPNGHLIWGDGNRPLGSYVKSIQENKYSGFLTQEITWEGYFNNPLEADIKNMNVLKAYTKV